MTEVHEVHTIWAKVFNDLVFLSYLEGEGDFDFLVVFISTCLVTVTPQCILFSEMVKRIVK